MSPLWPDGLPLTVETNAHGKPLRLRVDGDWLDIDLICNRWRASGEWREGETERECIKLATTSGALRLIAQDIADEQWYLIRVYD